MTLWLYLCNNIGTLPAKERLVKHLELEPELPHVIRDPEAVRQGGEPVLDVLICICYQTLKCSSQHKYTMMMKCKCASLQQVMSATSRAPPCCPEPKEKQVILHLVPSGNQIFIIFPLQP